ncbi:MAG TPA: hypothetical protein ENG40_00900 [Thermoprotei archaeon]|nr:hypothetical protein [Thermoprotei archaeon]
MPKRRGSRLEDLVASRYRKAGYDVRKHLITDMGEIDVFSRRNRKRFAIEVKSGKQTLTSTDVWKHIRKSRSLRAKPKFIVGPNVKFTSKARSIAKELGVSIMRLKFSRRKGRK